MNEFFNDGYVYIVAARVDGYMFDKDKAFFLGGLRQANECAKDLIHQITRIAIAFCPESRDDHEKEDWVWKFNGRQDTSITNDKLKAKILIARRNLA